MAACWQESTIVLGLDFDYLITYGIPRCIVE